MKSTAIHGGLHKQKQSSAQNNLVTAREWPTILLIVLCTASILLITVLESTFSLLISVPSLALAMTLHSSLQHEALHGHPTRYKGINELLVFVPFGLFVPYRRFRNTHLEHHIDERLTDPHEDPESNYMHPEDWDRLSKSRRRLLQLNNTLSGRIVIGPLIGMVSFYRNDLKLTIGGDRSIAQAYFLHVLALLPFMWFFSQYATLPAWAYILSAYMAMSILRVRTFLEHRADWKVRNRIVVIEDRGVFSWLFLNNNYHLVHHMHPGVCWYRLPALFRAHRDNFLRENDSYYYPNYRSIFASYLFKAKDPVPHPMSSSSDWRSAEVSDSLLGTR